MVRAFGSSNFYSPSMKMRYTANASQYRLAGSAALLVALFFVTIAFCTPYWLISDGLDPTRKFERLGLWEVCFNDFYDEHYRWDFNFHGCRWIFDRKYWIIRPLLQPPFFVAVQVLFTLGFTLVLIACIVMLATHMCLPPERELQGVRIATYVVFASAVVNMIAVIVFGALGDGRDWIPDPDHNYLSWSFALACIGTICQFVAAIFYWVDARHLNKQLYVEDHGYPMGQQPPAA